MMGVMAYCFQLDKKTVLDIYIFFFFKDSKQCEITFLQSIAMFCVLHSRNRKKINHRMIAVSPVLTVALVFNDSSCTKHVSHFCECEYVCMFVYVHVCFLLHVSDNLIACRAMSGSRKTIAGHASRRYSFDTSLLLLSKSTINNSTDSKTESTMVRPLTCMNSCFCILTMATNPWGVFHEVSCSNPGFFEIGLT